jgi:hypothetical protein
MLPSGVDDEVMLAVAPDVVDADRGGGRSAARRSGEEAFSVGLEAAGEGEGLSKTVSESTSASGVDGLEAMAREREKSRPRIGGVRGRGRQRERVQEMVIRGWTSRTSISSCDYTAEGGVAAISADLGVWVEVWWLWAVACKLEL